MADRYIGDLNPVESINASDNFILEQSGNTMRLQGQILINWLLKQLEGKGGITSITKTKTSGLVDTYTIAYASTDAATTFTVTNGAKGDKGDKSYMWIRYASQRPSAQNPTISSTPDDWIGFYVGDLSTAPTSWNYYSWFEIKGKKGDTGDPARLSGAVVQYAVSASGTEIPTGWVDSIPTVAQGAYLWTKVTINFNTGSPVQFYSVSHFGLDGSGAVSSVCGQSPDGSGNVQLYFSNIKESSGSNATLDEKLAEKQAKILVSGLLKGDGSGGITAAVAGTDYQAANKGLPVTLRASGWNSGTKKQMVTVTGVTSANNVLVSPAEASYAAYTEAQVRCCLQSVNTLEFVCEDVPTVDLTVNVLIMA